MRSIVLILLIGALVVPGRSLAQADLYDIGSVREVRLYFDEPNWSDLLDTLFLSEGDGRLRGDLVIDGTLITDVGVRYKGYSSYSPNRVKNPFNIKLNFVNAGQRYQGVDKLKLSNVIQDPSFVREALSYEIARKYMPASQANFANVYVNDVLIGLYTNVEDVDRGFIQRRFGTNANAFFKGNPTSIDLNGENANLSDSPGTDSASYYSLYSKESDHGWGELLELIHVLNNDPGSIENVLNVDRTLWMHAFNYAVINFDSYVGYAQNYYLYKDDNARWNPILWDMNMSFASFRLTDASIYWNGFGIPQAISMDPLQHHNNVSVVPRPLLRNLFLNPMYRRMYLAHLRTIIAENITNQEYRDRAVAMRDLITPYVLADPNKFYTDQAFADNLDQTVADFVDYPGITQLMDQRAVYLGSYPGMTGEPVITNVDHSPTDIMVGQTLFITANISAADTAFVAYRFDDGGLFHSVAMLDDGLHEDGTAGDGVYGAAIEAGSNRIQFYIYAENTLAGAFDPARAAFEYRTIITRLSPGDLVINEFMAYNTGHVLDEAGEADDWIELFNPNDQIISTAGLYLTDDDADPTKWALPTLVLGPGEYLIIWADGQTDQGANHANFGLDAAGESLTLGYPDASLDHVRFGAQYPIHTTGRFPNGTGSFRSMFPTFKQRNAIDDSSVLDQYVLLYPNPSNGDVFAIIDEDGPFEIQIFAADGRTITAPILRNNKELITLPVQDLNAGVYILQLRTSSGSTQRTFMITE